MPNVYFCNVANVELLGRTSGRKRIKNTVLPTDRKIRYITLWFYDITSDKVICTNCCSKYKLESGLRSLS